MGVLLTGAAATGNLLESNRVGTDATGTTGNGNNADGVEIVAGASDNTVGAGNILAANHLGAGVHITGAGTSGNLVTGSLIGSDATGDSGCPTTTP